MASETDNYYMCAHCNFIFGKTMTHDSAFEHMRKYHPDKIKTTLTPDGKQTLESCLYRSVYIGGLTQKVE